MTHKDDRSLLVLLLKMSKAVLLTLALAAARVLGEDCVDSEVSCTGSDGEGWCCPYTGESKNQQAYTYYYQLKGNKFLN